MQLSVCAGKDIDIDLDKILPDGPDYLERANTVASDPVAVAEWFHLVIDTVSFLASIEFFVSLYPL